MKATKRFAQLLAEIEHSVMGVKSKLQRLSIMGYDSYTLNAKQMSEQLDITYASASTLAKSLEEIGIFKEITGFKRNRLFLFAEYVDLFSRSE